MMLEAYLGVNEKMAKLRPRKRNTPALFQNLDFSRDERLLGSGTDGNGKITEVNLVTRVSKRS